MLNIWNKRCPKPKESLFPMGEADTITVLGYFQGVATPGEAKPVKFDKEQGVKYEINLGGKIYGSIYEKLISEPLTIKLNWDKSLTIYNYRSIQLANKMELELPDTTLQIGLILDNDRGIKLLPCNALYLKIIYKDDGKLVKFEVPGTPLIFDCKQLKECPVVTKYHNTIYTLPISNEVYIDLDQRGVVKIGDDNPAYLWDRWS